MRQPRAAALHSPFGAWGDGQGHHCRDGLKDVGTLGPGTCGLPMILFIAILLFGAKRIPEPACGLGQGIHNCEDAFRGTTPPPRRPDLSAGVFGVP